jgi:hypothetical protein
MLSKRWRATSDSDKSILIGKSERSNAGKALSMEQA